MTVLPILTDPESNPILRERCRPVAPPDWPEFRHLADDLRDTVQAASGLGLAAPQAGHPLRLFVVGEMIPGPHERIFVNPEIVARKGGRDTATEGCLSLPGVHRRVQRHRRVRVRFLDRDGAGMEGWFTGLLARCIQHEIDHLNGVLITDYAPLGVTAKETSHA